MSNQNIFILIVILSFLPNLVFAAVINSITPDKGIAGGIMTINGEGFGDGEKSIDAGYRYVRVGGFINTKIVSWKHSSIQIITPTIQEATSDITRLNPFWLIADAADVSLNLLTSATKLLDTRVSPPPTGIDNAVVITVVTPLFQESNQGFFTYVAQTPLGGVASDFNHLLTTTYEASYGRDIVGLLRNPKELGKTKLRETMRGLQEVPLFVRDLFTGQDPSKIISPHFETESQERQNDIEQDEAKSNDLQGQITNAVSGDEAIQWKTVDKPTFTIKIPQGWEEIPSPSKEYYSQVFRFMENNTGNFFEIGVDPIPVDGRYVDELWKIKVNASGDGVIMEEIEKMSYEDPASDDNKTWSTLGDDKLEITSGEEWDQGIKPPTIENHNYDFFFGNGKKEIGVDTEIFKEILNSFRTKEATGQTQVTPTVAALDKATAEKVILKKLKTDYLNWPTTGVSYDGQQGSYYDIVGRLNGSYADLENLGLVIVIVKGDIFTTARVKFTTKSEPYLVKDNTGKVQSVVEALPEKVEVAEISTEGYDINNLRSCSGNCYIVNYTATYQRTPFGQSFKENSTAKKNYEASAIITPADICWEVNAVLIHTSDTKKICL